MEYKPAVATYGGVEVVSLVVPTSKLLYDRLIISSLFKVTHQAQCTLQQTGWSGGCFQAQTPRYTHGMHTKDY